MKRIISAICLTAILSTPALAADMCREEAQAAGYVAALEMLEPCKKAQNTEDKRAEKQVTEERANVDARAVAHFKTTTSQ